MVGGPDFRHPLHKVPDHVATMDRSRHAVFPRWVGFLFFPVDRMTDVRIRPRSCSEWRGRFRFMASAGLAIPDTFALRYSDPPGRTMRTDAAFSNCRTYRYALWRVWDEALPRALFIGLNPSTADEARDDPTIRRCIGFARDWGYGGVTVANLFAFRATYPADLKAAADPVGPENDRWLGKLAAEAELVVAAWGNDGAFLDRSRIVGAAIPEMRCLKMNKSGEPAHPLYQPGSARPKTWKPRSSP